VSVLIKKRRNGAKKTNACQEPLKLPCAGNLWVIKPPYRDSAKKINANCGWRTVYNSLGSRRSRSKWTPNLCEITRKKTTSPGIEGGGERGGRHAHLGPEIRRRVKPAVTAADKATADANAGVKDGGKRN